MFIELSPNEFATRFPDAHRKLVELIAELIRQRQVTGFCFRYYIEAAFEGVVVAERKQQPGPREPGFIWDGDAWFCSEDAEGMQVELGWKLSRLAPGGIGGF